SCQGRFENFIFACSGDYSVFNEEKDSFGPGWYSQQQNYCTITNYNERILDAFPYRSTKLLDSYPYEAEHSTYMLDGSVYELG
ncbi:unnamed protein product, partial [Didymodactylos carnosus]